MTSYLSEEEREALRERYWSVRARMEEACRRCGRCPEDVTLIAVSKTKPVSMIEELAALGQKDFGENHVQEIVEKQAEFPDVSYHMIGHLQRNKVRKVVGKAVMIHSVDSLRLAEEISRCAVQKGLTVPVLVEVNVGNEESKYGFTFDEVEEAAARMALLPGIQVRGLMCVAPNRENSEENRPLFRKMRELSVDIRGKNTDNTEKGILSMGMTKDFEIAIEEGATHIRVGTALFGSRNYGNTES